MSEVTVRPLNIDVFLEDNGLFDQIYLALCEDVQMYVEKHIAFDCFIVLFTFKESARELQHYLLELCSSSRLLYDLYITDTNGSLAQRTKLCKAIIVKFDMKRMSNRIESSAAFLHLPGIIRTYNCAVNKAMMPC
jgi:hypothetical protein